MKNKMSYIKLLLLMVMGAAIGMGGNIIFSLLEGGMKNLAVESGKIIHQTGLIIESVMTLAAFAAVLAIYIYIRRLWKLEESSEDEVADICGEKFEHWAEIGITITNIASGVLLIFGTISFPGESMNIEKEDAIRFLILSAVMIWGVVSMAVMQILFYHLIQKRDPQKKGDPSSFTFNKKWMEGCDETEKLVIYQAGYKAYNSMQITMLVGLILAIFGKMQFNTGNFPLVLLGSMWIIGTLSFGKWKMKGLNKK